MLKRLIAFSIDHATLVLVLAGLLLIYAGWRLPRVPVDVFPELNAPTVVIMTEAPGLAADEVEQFVTFPIESAVNGIPGVRRVRSGSAISLSVVYVEFDWGRDIYRARQLVAERLDTVRDVLPDGAHAEMTPITSITGEIMLLAISSPDGSISDLDLRAYAEFDLRNRLLAIPGISQITVIGGELPEYQVLVSQERLRLHELTMHDVVDAARRSHTTLSAGYLSNVDGLEVPIRQGGRVQSIEDIAGTLVRLDPQTGSPLTIGDVADVRLGPALKRGTGADLGRPAVIMSVQKAPGTNTLAITEQVDAALDGIDASLPEGILINRAVFRQSDFIDRSIQNVTHALRDAAIIVAVIILLFLFNVRTTIITLVALPLSLAVGVLALEWMGLTINVMTIGGFAIAVGSLVDDAIIDVENVHRRLRQSAAAGSEPDQNQLPTSTIIYNASNEIRPAMVFATIIIAMVFLPLMFLGGLEGRFFRPLGIAFIVAIMASLLVALTVIPAMCRLLLRKPSQERAHHDPILVRFLKRLYEPAVRAAIRFRWLVLGGAATATVACVLLASTFGTSFLPAFNEGTMTLMLMAPPGTSLEASDRLASHVERQIMQIEGVRGAARRTGRAERDEHAEPVSSSEIDVGVLPGYDYYEVREEISRVLAQIPGITTSIGQPIEHRLSHVLSGTPAAIAINVFGEDLAVLRTIASEIETELKALPGARDVAANREVRIQSLPVNYRARELAAYGLTPADAAEQVRNAIYGATVAHINDGSRRYDLTVRLLEQERATVRDIRQLILRGSGGAIVRLDEVADIGPELASNLIARENAQRKAVISLNVERGHNLGHLIEQVRERVNPIVEQHGYHVTYGGQFEAQQSASRTIALFSAIVILVMLVLLNLAIGSWRIAMLVMVNVPLALIGGVLAVYFTDSKNVASNTMALFGGGTYIAPILSIASLVGFITLFGIAVRNGILLVNHYRNLMVHEGATLEQAIVRGSSERLVPILMTALTAALALLPIVIKGDQPGNELLAPLSVVILGGLLTSTFLNLIVVPAGYAAIHRQVSGGISQETRQPAVDIERLGRN